MPRRVHIVAGALWRVVEKLMSARIDRDIDLHTLLITAREVGKAVLDNAERNDKLRQRFRLAYGVDIKEYFDRCMAESARDCDLDSEYAEYLCWYSLLLRVFLITRTPKAPELEAEKYEEAEEEASQIGE